MTKKDLENYKTKTLSYLNKRLKECTDFLLKNPNSKVLLKRYDNLKNKIEEVNNFKA